MLPRRCRRARRHWRGRWRRAAGILNCTAISGTIPALLAAMRMANGIFCIPASAWPIPPEGWVLKPSPQHART